MPSAKADSLPLKRQLHKQNRPKNQVLWNTRSGGNCINKST